MERWPTSLIIREIPIKIMRYHLTPIRIGITKKIRDKKNVDEDVEKSEFLCTLVGGGCKLVQPLWIYT